MPGAIDASGLKQLRRAFKAIGSKEFDRKMGQAHQAIAQQVIDRARPGLASESTRAAAALTAMRSATGAKIKVSPQDAPQAGGLIFGAHHDRWRRAGVRVRSQAGIRHARPDIMHKAGFVKGYNQFPEYRENEPYHIFPEVDELRDQITADYQQVIDEFLGEQGVSK